MNNTIEILKNLRAQLHEENPYAYTISGPIEHYKVYTTADLGIGGATDEIAKAMSDFVIAIEKNDALHPDDVTPYVRMLGLIIEKLKDNRDALVAELEALTEALELSECDAERFAELEAEVIAATSEESEADAATLANLIAKLEDELGAL